MIKRQLSNRILNALSMFPVVFVSGPRQAGKTTLAKHLAKTRWPAEYVNLDDFNMAWAAESNPESFLRAYNKLVVDEIQYVPQLFRPLKMLVDEARQTGKKNANGRYLLTGSSNIMTLPALSDALVGRMSVLSLYPLSTLEISQGKGEFLTRLMKNEFQPQTIHRKIEVAEMIRLATFPEITNSEDMLRQEWFEAYVKTILYRDVRQIVEIEKMTALPILLKILASRVSGLINEADIARSIRQNPVTAKKYRILLQMAYLTFDVKPWYRNIGKRLVKSPKGYFTDTSLLCYLQQIDMTRAEIFDPERFGPVFENFVVSELLKQQSSTGLQGQLYHFRTSDGHEVDIVFEQANGKLAGIEIKSRDKVAPSDFKGLKELQKQAGDDFVCGIVLYRGRNIIPVGEQCWAVPVDLLWA